MSGIKIPRTLGQGSILSFPFLRDFFQSWFKLDITRMASAVTLIATILAGVRSLRGVWSYIYWWILKCFTSSISIASHDGLNKEVLNWIGVNIVDKQNSRILTANTQSIQGDHQYPGHMQSPRHVIYPGGARGARGASSKKHPVRYLPSFGLTWFFHDGTLFITRLIRGDEGFSRRTPNAYTDAPTGREPLLLLCLGRSTEPIKRFIEICRAFTEKQKERYVSVIGAGDPSAGQPYWGNPILKPIRHLNTIHFNEEVKLDLVEDITRYLSVATTKFYQLRGIPYRRGYLFHGPPGTGKTSLSLALAGMFNLSIYQLHLPSVRGDTLLQGLFGMLPTQCLVVLEDIDAVGAKRDLEDDESDSEDNNKLPVKDRQSQNNDPKKLNEHPDIRRAQCTLSGLLNVIDGITSQEGRILIMTSNFPDKLDAALTRPGRIDKMVYLSEISKDSAKNMFLRMFMPDNDIESKETEKSMDTVLESLAMEFANKLPESTFTPAEIQGFMLMHRESREKAVACFDSWIAQELAKKQKTKRRKDHIAARTAKSMQQSDSRREEGGASNFDVEKIMESDNDEDKDRSDLLSALNVLNVIN